MIKRFCDVCGAEIVRPIYDVMIYGKSNANIECRDRYELCCDCANSMKANIGNRRAKAERE